jgi:hypothetical protein
MPDVVFISDLTRQMDSLFASRPRLMSCSKTVADDCTKRCNSKPYGSTQTSRFDGSVDLSSKPGVPRSSRGGRTIS